jgi:hypothetical protein
MPMGDEQSVEAGVPGTSAGREDERRRTKRERLGRERHPRIGRALLALRRSPPWRRHLPCSRACASTSAIFRRWPHDELSWRTGGGGEVTVARILERRCVDRVVLLHDRPIPGRQTNIDHIAVARSGVWVIDAKRHGGKVRLSKMLCGQTKLSVAGRDKTRLTVDGRDRTRLIDGLAAQVEFVAAAVAAVDPAIPVHGAMCFVAPKGKITSGALPALRTLRIRGYALLRPGSLARCLNRKGDLSREQMASIASMLARRFPIA